MAEAHIAVYVTARKLDRFLRSTAADGTIERLGEGIKAGKGGNREFKLCK